MSIDAGGFGPSSSYRFSGSTDARSANFRYPSPWWDIAHMSLPLTIKSLFRDCRYHLLANPLISSVTRKMAEYPITEVIIDSEGEDGFGRQRERWDSCLHEVLNIHRFQVEVGLDYTGFGNCLVSILFPFKKILKCRRCGYSRDIKRLKFRSEWDFRNFEHELNCPQCGTRAPALVTDEWIRSYRDIKLIRWNPSDIDIDFNPITQSSEYYYTIPTKVRTRIVEKNQRYLEETPQNLILAVKMRQPFKLKPANVFHFKAPTPSLDANDGGWGYPLLLPALKDSFYLQILKKANEAIALERLIPLDIFFPSSADNVANPYLTVNLSDWKRRVENEILMWRQDPNRKPVLPLPVGYQRIGGDGRSLLPVQEIRAWSEHIVTGMGVPQEFAFGGLSWTGSSVSLRMLENHFLNYREAHKHFLETFLIPAIARFMGWRKVSVHMKAFKMADDVQSKQLLMSLNQMRKIADKTLLAEFDKDAMDELKLIEGEMKRNLDLSKVDQLAKAQIQGEASVVMAKYQAEAQQVMQDAQQKAMGGQSPMGSQQVPPDMSGGDFPAAGQPAQPDGQGVDVLDLSEAYAKRIAGLPEEQQAAILQQMATQSPRLHELVMQKMTVLKAQAQRPLPEQRPPRGKSATI